MAGNAPAKVRRVVDGSVAVVYVVTTHQRGAVGVLVDGEGRHADHLRGAGRINSGAFDELLRQLVDTGTVTVSNDVVAATPLGRFDLLPDASKTAFLCLARAGAGNKVRESFAAGSGRHPASFRVFEGGMAAKARGGYWTLTAMGKQTAAAVIAAGLCPK